MLPAGGGPHQQLADSFAEVVTIARDRPDPIALFLRDDPKPVMLDFVIPAGIGWGLFSRARQARLKAVGAFYATL
jgi:hypothetical protein